MFKLVGEQRFMIDESKLSQKEKKERRKEKP